MIEKVWTVRIVNQFINLRIYYFICNLSFIYFVLLTKSSITQLVTTIMEIRLYCSMLMLIKIKIIISLQHYLWSNSQNIKCKYKTDQFNCSKVSNSPFNSLDLDFINFYISYNIWINIVGLILYTPTKSGSVFLKSPPCPPPWDVPGNQGFLHLTSNVYELIICRFFTQLGTQVLKIVTFLTYGILQLYFLRNTNKT